MLLQIFNGPMPTTASQVAVATGTSIKTLLQLSLKAAVPKAKLVEWGISLDGSAAATPGIVELCETDVAATVTAHVASGIHLFGDPNDPDPTTNLINLGTAATGYTASAEGSITALRQFDAQLIAPTNQYIKQFPLGREPVLNLSKFLRVRVKFGATVNAITYVTLEI